MSRGGVNALHEDEGPMFCKQLLQFSLLCICSAFALVVVIYSSMSLLHLQIIPVVGRSWLNTTLVGLDHTVC